MTRQRLYASTTIVAGPLLPAVRLVATGSDAALVVHAVEASDEGLFCVLDVQARGPARLRRRSELAGRSTGPATDPRIWVEWAGSAVESHIQTSVTRPLPDGVVRHEYRLWFPVPIGPALGSVDLRVAWTALSPVGAGVRLRGDDLVRAAAVALDLAGVGSDGR